MSEKAYAERLARSIESLGCTEVIRSTFSETGVTVLFRVTTKFPDGKIDERVLLQALERLVLHDPEGKGPWLSHVCSRLLPKQGEDKQWRMVKGWSIAINSRNFDVDMGVVSRLLRGEPAHEKVNPGEITEFPLVGSSPTRNKPGTERGKGKGKGAWTIGGREDFKP